MIHVQYQRGVHLPDLGLWLDPQDPKPFAFVSHAHSDHIAPHEEIVLSGGTARLMQARMPGVRREHVLPFGETVAFEGFRATLLPAGHIFGSAQIHLETEAGSLLYTGDFKLRPSLSAEPLEWRQADTLIMETTYGLPKYRMPPTAEVMASMVRFCHEALDEKAVPVLLGYSLGKSQEILCALLENGLTPMLHGSVYRMTEIYRVMNPDFPTGYVRYAPSELEGKVLVCPPSAARSLMLLRIKNRRTAVLTGWALDPGAKFRYGCDAAFPLTDHADYPDLIRYVELVQPKRVLTLHGFAAQMAHDLRDRGLEAWALTEADQLELMLRSESAEPVVVPGADLSVVETPALPEEPVVIDSFTTFANIGQQISASTGKLKKIQILADYLRSVTETDAASAGLAAIYLTGRAFPQSDNRTLQTGWAVIRRALSAASRKPEHVLREIGRMHGDAGKTAYEALLENPQTQALSLAESRTLFESLRDARGPLRKTDILEAALSRVGPLQGSYLIKILTGDLRIGLKEGLVEEAIAEAFGAPLEEVREANMLLGDIGETTILAQSKSLGTATIRLFRPIKCMLASPEPNAAAIWERLIESETSRLTASSVAVAGVEAPPASGHSFWVEDKYDGIRAQLHAADGQVKLFSRDLRDMTGQFADLVRAARPLARQVILDGELIAFEAGRALTFFDLQKRLGRKTEDDLFLGRSDVPVIYRAFDLLSLDGVSLLRHPLLERRKLLESLSFPSGLEIAPITHVDSGEEIEQAFQTARRRGNEGLIAKDGTSAYTPGRRGLAWLKLKKELATLDVVVVGAELGHGKRSGVLSDYTFAVRDDVTGAFLTIGKAYSGVTDEEIDELTDHFRASTISIHGKYREVRPEVVFEVAFDSVQESDRHNSGLALRFPRIKAIRRDKTPAEIDSLSYARSLVRRGTGAKEET